MCDSKQISCIYKDDQHSVVDILYLKKKKKENLHPSQPPRQKTTLCSLSVKWISKASGATGCKRMGEKNGLEMIKDDCTVI